MTDRLRIEVLLNAIDRATGPFRSMTGAAAKAAEAVRKSKGALKDLGSEKKSISHFVELRRELRANVPELDRLQQAADVARIKLAAQAGAHKQLTAELRTEKLVVAAHAKALRTSTEVNENDVKAQQARELALIKLKDRYKESSAGLRLMRNETSKATSAVTQMSKNQTKLNGRLEAVKTKLQAAGLSTDKYASRQRELHNEIKRVSAAMKVQEARAESLAKSQALATNLKTGGMSKFTQGSSIALTGIGATRTAVAPIAAAMEFESVMAGVKKVVNFDTPKQFKQMGDDILAMSNRLPMAAEGIAQIVTFAGQSLGQDASKKELLQFAEDAVKMGIAFDMSAEEAGDTMAKWRVAMGMTRDEAMRLGDQVNYLGNTGPTNAAKITAIISRVGALGKVSGLVQGPMSALAATIGNTVEEDVAGTGIKNLLLRLTSGASATGKQAQAFRNLGLSAKQVAKDMQVDAQGTILKVLERVNSLPADLRSSTIAQLFGTESVSAITPLLTNLPLLKENFDKVADASKYGGSMLAEYLGVSETTANRLQLLKNSANATAITLGATLLDSVAELTQWIAPLLQKVTAWAKENPTLAKGLMLAAVGGAVLLTVVGGAIAIFGVLAMGLGHIIGLFTMLRGLEFGGKLASGATKLGGAFKTMGRFAIRALLGIGRTILTVGRFLLLSPLGLALSALALAAYMVWKNWDGMKAGAILLWQDICTGVSAAWDWLKSKMLALWGYISGLWDRFKTMGSNLLQGLIAGLLGGLGAAKDAIMSVGGKVIGWLKEKLGIHSPSRVFASLGGYTMAGFTQGLLGGESGAQAALSRIGNGLRKTGAGIAIGSTLAAGAATASTLDHRPPLAAGARGGAAISATYNITINAAPGQSGQDIAALVRAEIERIEHQRRVRTRSELSDYE